MKFIYINNVKFLNIELGTMYVNVKKISDLKSTRVRIRVRIRVLALNSNFDLILSQVQKFFISNIYISNIYEFSH